MSVDEKKVFENAFRNDREPFQAKQARIQAEANDNRTMARHKSAKDTTGENMVRIGTHLVLNRVQLEALLSAVKALNSGDKEQFQAAVLPLPEIESLRTRIEFGRLIGPEFVRTASPYGL